MALGLTLAASVDEATQLLPLGLVRPPGALAQLVHSLGAPSYRAAQIHHWVFRRGVGDPAAMTDLPAALRAELAQPARSATARLAAQRTSADGSVKALLELDGQGRTRAAIEAVLIPAEDRLTLCVSSQAGCAVGCPFCATGLMGLVRQLAPEEIAGQMLWARRVAGRWPTHVVFMGMGEPMANYEAVRAAIDLMRAPHGFGLGARRMVLSTAGHVPGIRRLAAEPGLQVGLAVSLHAPDDELRGRLVPLNRAYPLAELMAACREYTQLTRRRVTFEYVLLKDVNDRPGHARALARLVSGMLSHVNLIPYNPVPGLPFEPPAPARVRRFADLLESLSVPVTVRWSKGLDIQAACGQLRAAVAPASAGRGCGGRIG